MSIHSQTTPKANAGVRLERHFQRFSLAQRWEHTILILSVLVLLLTGLPQKYRAATWSQQILTTPERVETIRQIHHIAAIVLAAEALYHLGHAFWLLARRKLPGGMLPTYQDVRDAWQMLQYLLYIKKEKPLFGKYNYEQKINYWFFFFGIGILGVTGLILWFPEFFTRFLPGGVVPAAKLAHSTEAIVAVIFVALWHFYHVHIERLNLSIFTGWLNETDMRDYHTREYQRLTGGVSQQTDAGEQES